MPVEKLNITNLSVVGFSVADVLVQFGACDELSVVYIVSYDILRDPPPHGVNPRAVISACVTGAKLLLSTFLIIEPLGITDADAMFAGVSFMGE